MKRITTGQQRDLIVSRILQESRNEEHYFGVPVRIDLSPLQEPVMIYGIAISPMKEIWLLSDGKDEIWSKLEESDINYDCVIGALHEKLFSYQHKAA